MLKKYTLQIDASLGTQAWGVPVLALNDAQAQNKSKVILERDTIAAAATRALLWDAEDNLIAKWRLDKFVRAEQAVR